MARKVWKSGTFIYPIPAVLISSGTMEKSNIMTNFNDDVHGNRPPYD